MFILIWNKEMEFPLSQATKRCPFPALSRLVEDALQQLVIWWNCVDNKEGAMLSSHQ